MAPAAGSLRSYAPSGSVGDEDIRYVEELLGHVRLDTTQIYTHVSIRKLKQVHSATHPGAKMERRGEVEEG